MAGTTPRGVRNNNPLNIRYNQRNCWKGQTGTDGQFCKFSSPKWGVRAAVKILQKYAGQDSKATILEIINKWAPRSDGNNTNAYIATVCNRMNMNPTDTIDVHNGWSVVRLLYSMAQVECTAEALKAAQIDISDFIDGYYLAALDYEKG